MSINLQLVTLLQLFSLHASGLEIVHVVLFILRCISHLFTDLLEGTHKTKRDKRAHKIQHDEIIKNIKLLKLTTIPNQLIKCISIRHLAN